MRQCRVFVFLLAAMATVASQNSPQPPVATQQTQMAVLFPVKMDEDPAYDPKLRSPAYASEHPLVLLDRGHRNDAFWRSASKLFIADGYEVRGSLQPFTYELLRDVKVLVLMNAGIFMKPKGELQNREPGISEEEAALLYDWVAGG